MAGISSELVYCLIKNIIIRRFGGCLCHRIQIGATCPVLRGGGLNDSMVGRRTLDQNLFCFKKYTDLFTQAQLSSDCL
jgi:hypothetical protein